MQNPIWLINQTNTSLAKSPQFALTDCAVRLTCSGLTGSEFVGINVWVGDKVNGAYTPLARNGALVRLTALNNQHIEAIKGEYEVFLGGQYTGVAVYADYDDIIALDSNVRYNVSVGATL